MPQLFKILFSIVLIHIYLCGFSQGKWEQIDIPTQSDLNSVFFTDSINGWVVGNGGLILHTVDGGESWFSQESNTENDIVDVFFLNSNLGWASSFNYITPPYGTLLLKTTNGGNNWVSEPYPEENIFINCILFTDSLTGWMGGSPHKIVRTIDGGSMWQEVEMDTTALAFFPVLSIEFYNEQYGYACGGIFDIAGVCWRTDDGGEKWYAIDINQAPADEIHGIVVLDSLNVIGAGGDPDFGYGVGIISTDDGGYNWGYDEIGVQGNAFDIDFVNSIEIWAPLGNQGKFIYSLDAGINWTPIPTPNGTNIYDVIFPDSLHGYAVGRDGAMLKFIDAITVGVNTINTSATEVKLKNYPNPFGRKTTISFEIPIEKVDNLNYTILIFDLIGNEIIRLNPKNISSGINKVEFDAEALTPGIYSYQLRNGSSILKTNKMVLTR